MLSNKKIKALKKETEELVKDGIVFVVEENWKKLYLYNVKCKITKLEKKWNLYEVDYKHIWDNVRWLITLYKTWRMLDRNLNLLPQEIIDYNDLKLWKIIDTTVYIDAETWEHNKIIYHGIKLNKEEVESEKTEKKNIVSNISKQELKEIEEIIKEVEKDPEFREIIEDIKNKLK